MNEVPAYDGRLILVVEDNAETADVLRRILVLREYRVVLAEDGLDALSLLRNGLRPAAIVLDLAMPNVDGWTLHAAVLADPELARIPIVVYTALGEAAALPNVVGHVHKGTDSPDVLLRCVEAACARGRRSQRRSPRGDVTS